MRAEAIGVYLLEVNGVEQYELVDENADWICDECGLLKLTEEEERFLEELPWDSSGGPKFVERCTCTEKGG